MISMAKRAKPAGHLTRSLRLDVSPQQGITTPRSSKLARFISSRNQSLLSGSPQNSEPPRSWRLGRRRTLRGLAGCVVVGTGEDLTRHLQRHVRDARRWQPTGVRRDENQKVVAHLHQSGARVEGRIGTVSLAREMDPSTGTALVYRSTNAPALQPSRPSAGSTQAPPAGFEPATVCLEGSCSIRAELRGPEIQSTMIRAVL
jgi:hypothetical protein